jgi:hypothetical protein
MERDQLIKVFKEVNCEIFGSNKNIENLKLVSEVMPEVLKE